MGERTSETFQLLVAPAARRPSGDRPRTSSGEVGARDGRGDDHKPGDTGHGTYGTRTRARRGDRLARAMARGRDFGIVSPADGEALVFRGTPGGVVAASFGQGLQGASGYDRDSSAPPSAARMAQALARSRTGQSVSRRSDHGRADSAGRVSGGGSRPPGNRPGNRAGARGGRFRIRNGTTGTRSRGGLCQRGSPQRPLAADLPEGSNA